MKQIFLALLLFTACSNEKIKINPGEYSPTPILNGSWYGETGDKNVRMIRMNLSVLEKEISEYEVKTRKPDLAGVSHIVGIFHMDFYPKRKDLTCKIPEERYYKLVGRKISGKYYLSSIHEEEGIKRMAISVNFKPVTEDEILLEYNEFDLATGDLSKLDGVKFKKGLKNASTFN